MLKDQIPLIDISPLRSSKFSPKKVEKTAREIYEACTKFGFFYIFGHGVPPELLEDLEGVSRRFFRLPHEEKMRISMELGGRAWRGFFPVGGELTSGQPDMKEGLYFGTEHPLHHPMVLKCVPLHGKNLFPESMPEMKKIVLKYLEIMTSLAHTIMEGMALSLGQRADYFEKYSRQPTILFRIFNYPLSGAQPQIPGRSDQADQDQEAQWGVGEHTDYGVLTILKQDEVGGLEVKVKGQWIEAPPIPGTFICNIGDMLDRMTGGLYRSTPHRVKRPPQDSSHDRISFPFFFDPDFNAEVKGIRELPNLEDDKEERWDRASVHDFKGTYGEYLLEKVGKVFPDLKQKQL